MERWFLILAPAQPCAPESWTADTSPRHKPLRCGTEPWVVSWMLSIVCGWCKRRLCPGCMQDPALLSTAIGVLCSHCSLGAAGCCEALAVSTAYCRCPIASPKTRATHPAQITQPAGMGSLSFACMPALVSLPRSAREAKKQLRSN